MHILITTRVEQVQNSVPVLAVHTYAYDKTEAKTLPRAHTATAVYTEQSPSKELRSSESREVRVSFSPKPPLQVNPRRRSSHGEGVQVRCFFSRCHRCQGRPRGEQAQQDPGEGGYSYLY